MFCFRKAWWCLSWSACSRPDIHTSWKPCWRCCTDRPPESSQSQNPRAGFREVRENNICLISWLPGLIALLGLEMLRLSIISSFPNLIWYRTFWKTYVPRPRGRYGSELDIIPMIMEPRTLLLLASLAQLSLALECLMIGKLYEERLATRHSCQKCLSFIE